MDVGRLSNELERRWRTVAAMNTIEAGRTSFMQIIRALTKRVDAAALDIDRERRPGHATV
jgi:hypothetical protein